MEDLEISQEREILIISQDQTTTQDQIITSSNLSLDTEMTAERDLATTVVSDQEDSTLGTAEAADSDQEVLLAAAE